MFCSKCGNQLDESVRFCGKCGALQEAPNAPAVQNNISTNAVSPSQPGSKLLKISGIILVIYCVLLTLIGIIHRQDMAEQLMYGYSHYTDVMAGTLIIISGICGIIIGIIGIIWKDNPQKAFILQCLGLVCICFTIYSFILLGSEYDDGADTFIFVLLAMIGVIIEFIYILGATKNKAKKI